MVHEGVLGADEPVAGSRGRASSSRRPRAARPRTAGRAGRAARRCRGASRGRTSSRVAMSNTWPSRSRARARGELEHLAPGLVVGRDLGLVADPVGDRARRARRRGRPAARIRRGSHPGGTSVSLLSSTSTSPRASARPWLQARAKPALSGFSTRRTRGFARRELAQVLRRAVARAVVDHDHLVAGVLGAGEHALEAHAREQQVVVGHDHDARRRRHGQGCTCRAGTGRARDRLHRLRAAGGSGGARRASMSRSGGNGAVPWLRDRVARGRS